MHLRAAEVGGCAPRSLSLYLQQPALRVCSTEDLFTPPPTSKSHLMGRELDSFAIRPSHPGMASAFSAWI